MTNAGIQESDYDPVGSALKNDEQTGESEGLHAALEGTVIEEGDEEGFLSLEQIFDADDVTEMPVKVPEWGGKVLVRSITKRQLNAITKNAADENDNIDREAVERGIFILGMVIPKTNEKDYERLLDKSASAMQTVTKAILGQSRMGEGKVTEEERKFSDG